MIRSSTALAAAVLGVALSGTCVPAQQLVKDLETTPITPTSMPQGLVDLGNRAVFTAFTREAGRELWSTDGTAAGTFRLQDLIPGANTSGLVLHTEYQGRLVFTVPLAPQVIHHYVTDGTVAGTTVIPDLGVEIGTFRTLANGTLLAFGPGGAYRTDLTPAGTTPIGSLRNFDEVVVDGNVSYGTHQIVPGDIELWATDGTAAGTHLIASLATSGIYAGVVWNGRVYFEQGAGTTSITSTNGTDYVTHVTLQLSLAPPGEAMFVRNNKLLFRHTAQLWASDLTSAGTGPIGAACNDVGLPVEVGGTIAFRATTASAGYELWTTDGTAAGTQMVADVMPGQDGSHPEHLRVTAAGLYCRCLTPQGRRLFRFNPPGTLTDLGAIPNDAPTAVALDGESGLLPFQGGLLFSGTDATGTELWSYDGSQPPARLVDIDSSARGISVYKPPFAAVRDRVFFAGGTLATGIEAITSDGTANGTRVLDLIPGTQSGFGTTGSNTAFLGRFRDQALMSGSGGTFLSDGVGLVQLATATGPAKVVGDDIYTLDRSALRLLHSDGTAAGTMPLPLTLRSSTEDFEVLAHDIVFRGVGVYGSDGVAYPQVLPITGGAQELYRLDDDHVMVATSDGIYLTDGTVAGTQTVALTFTLPRLDTQRDGVVHLFAYDRIWRVDASGGSVVAQVPLAAMVVHSLFATATQVFAVATTAATGRELFRLDPVQGALVLTTELVPGPMSGVVDARALGSGDMVFVSGGDYATGGVEPHVYDGVLGTMTQLADIDPGYRNSNPLLLGVADDTVFFVAADQAHGSELWSMPLAATTAGAVQEYGAGCPGSAGTPHLTASRAQPLTAQLDYELAGTRNFTLTALGLSLTDASVPFGGCELLLGGSIATRIGMSGIDGRTTFGLSVPVQPAFLGLRFASQGFALDAFAQAGFVASQGVLVVVGR